MYGTEELTREIVDRYLGGESGPAIARELGISFAYVYDVLDLEGVPRRRGGVDPTKLEKRDHAVRDMHRDGFDQAHIARSLGVSRQRVHQIINKGKTHEQG